MRLVLIPLLALALVGISRPAEAGPKKYSFALVKVIPKSDIKAELVKAAQPRTEAQIKAGFAGNARLVVLDNAPDPKTKANEFKALVAKKGLAGAYNVTVDIVEATEELVPIEGKPNSQRLVVHINLHMLGEKVPEMTMGFSGDGQSTVKIEIGKKLRDRDREYAWDEVAKDAVAKAIAESLKTLDTPPKKK